MPQCTRRLEFDAGHRLVGHESKCANLHGHRYVVEITVEAFELDRIGRVIDFSVLKSVVGQWIDDNWDHGMILNGDDPLLKLTEPQQKEIFGKKPPYEMSENPTVENMVEELARVSKDLLRNHDIRVVEVKMWETPNCSATWKAESK